NGFAHAHIDQTDTHNRTTNSRPDLARHNHKESIMRYVTRLDRKRRSNSVSVRSRRRLRFALERLEDRLVPSTILWTNRGSATSDSDGFNNVFGTSAETARGVVAAALRAWQDVIESFNYSDVKLNDTYRMTVKMQPGGTGLGASASPTKDVGGKP